MGGPVPYTVRLLQLDDSPNPKQAMFPEQARKPAQNCTGVGCTVHLSTWLIQRMRQPCFPAHEPGLYCIKRVAPLFDCLFCTVECVLFLFSQSVGS